MNQIKNCEKCRYFYIEAPKQHCYMFLDMMDGCLVYLRAPTDYEPCPQCEKRDFISGFDRAQHIAGCVKFN